MILLSCLKKWYVQENRANSKWLQLTYLLATLTESLLLILRQLLGSIIIGEEEGGY